VHVTAFDVNETLLDLRFLDPYSRSSLVTRLCAGSGQIIDRDLGRP
jgi:hypothetical protein